MLSYDVYGGTRPLTRRPLSRPQSARVRREIADRLHNMAIDCMAADQAASLKRAQDYRDQTCDNAQLALMLHDDLRRIHVETFKERERLALKRQAHEYYTTDMRRTQDWKSEVDSKFEEHSEFKAAETQRRGFKAELNRRKLMRRECMWSVANQKRASKCQRGANQNRAHLLETMQEQLELAHSEKAHKIQNFQTAQERQQWLRHTTDISKEIERTQCRITHMQGELHSWEVSYGGNPEGSYSELLIIEDKLCKEEGRLAELKSELEAALTQKAKRQRPRSAMMLRSGLCGIPSFSDPPRPSSPCSDATGLGPPVSVVNHRVGHVRKS
mmetsp:Transcript_130113/g.243357  ORF Transcript_130113/g.243357 Transcript_130113/m.243357 type:complete len:328 (+) Transcript_130113:131-1114(+)